MSPAIFNVRFAVRLMVVALVALPLLLSACSVGMALSGKENKDTSILFPGAPRAVVIAKLGVPNTSVQEDGKWVDSYVVHEGNEPSLGRAAAHAGLNLATLGVWEFIGTAWELAAGTSETTRLVIYYDDEDKVSDVKAVSATEQNEAQ